MNIKEALNCLENEEKIRRPMWEGGAYYYQGHGDIGFHCPSVPQDSYYNSLPLHEVLATDWEIYNPEERIEVHAKDIRVGDTILRSGQKRQVISVKIHLDLKDYYVQEYNLNEIVTKIVNKGNK